MNKSRKGEEGDWPWTHFRARKHPKSTLITWPDSRLTAHGGDKWQCKAAARADQPPTNAKLSYRDWLDGCHDMGRVVEMPCDGLLYWR